MEMIENLVELRKFLNSKTEEELEKMSFAFELIYWDNHWLRKESEDHEISHMTFDNGNLVCHEYREKDDNN